MYTLVYLHLRSHMESCRWWSMWPAYWFPISSTFELPWSSIPSCRPWCLSNFVWQGVTLVACYVCSHTCINLIGKEAAEEEMGLRKVLHLDKNMDRYRSGLHLFNRNKMNEQNIVSVNILANTRYPTNFQLSSARTETVHLHNDKRDVTCHGKEYICTAW